MRKFKINKKKKSKIEIAYITGVEFINTSNPYLLPLFDFFDFDFSFLILPGVIFDNMPISFL